jgi:hypothetical protein
MPMAGSCTSGATGRRERGLPSKGVNTEPAHTGRVAHDAEPRQCVEQLRSGHPRREDAVARLRAVLARVALHELPRLRGQQGSIAGPEVEV